MRLTKGNLAKILIVATIPFIGNVSYADSSNPEKSLSQLQKMNKVTTSIDEMQSKNMDRMRAMKDAAIGVGAQHGYVSQMKVLKEFVTSQQKSLDDSFDFATLMRLSGDKVSGMYLLPAVIEEVKDAQAVSDDGMEFRSSGTVYRIKERERLVSAPPNWREYLLWDLEADLSKPHELLLPKTPQEQEAWSKWVAEGWNAGVIQAEQEMSRRARELGAEFTGMVRYTRLVVEGKASEAKVIAQHRAVVGGGDMMREADSIYRVSSPVSLNPRAESWKTIITDPRKGLRNPAEFSDMD
jgi:defect-in-organelle-trafficking protein DotC